MSFFIAIVTILAIRFVYYLRCFLLMRYYLNRFQRWLKEEDLLFYQVRGQVIKLIKQAGVTDATLGAQDFVGMGTIKFYTGSLFDNFPNIRSEFVQMSFIKIQEAIGNYKHLMFDTLNPFYWFEFFVYLPRNVLNYIGVKSDNLASKLIQVLYWFSSCVIGFLLASNKPQIIKLLKDLMIQFFDFLQSKG